MSMFPGAGAQVYYNEAGEPLGWDVPSDEPEERNDEDDWNVWEDDDQREDEDDEPSRDRPRAVRVLRVLEYIYETPGRAVADMARWKVQGEYSPSSDMKITSRSFPMEFTKNEPEDTIPATHPSQKKQPTIHPRASDDANGGDL